MREPSNSIEAKLSEALEDYLKEYGPDGYTVGTFFSYAARWLLEVPIDSPIYMHHECDAYCAMLNVAAESAWKVVREAKALIKTRSARRKGKKR